MKMLNKKGQIVSSLQGFVMAIVTIAVVLAIGLYVLQEVSNNTKANGVSTAASNATDDIIDKLGNAPTWIGLLIVVVFATAILAYFYMRG
jgi:uncharacterized protein (UPF0333 family)